jgi:hypothetical protein
MSESLFIVVTRSGKRPGLSDLRLDYKQNGALPHYPNQVNNGATQLYIIGIGGRGRRDSNWQEPLRLLISSK